MKLYFSDDLQLLARLEFERDRVDTVPRVGRRLEPLAVKNMAKMPATV